MAEATAPATRVQYAEPSRDDLVRGLWPDKALYAGVMLFVTGFVGVLTGAVQLTVGLRYSPNLPPMLASWPAWVTIALSLFAGIAAYQALKLRSTAWAMRGCLLAFLSLGFLGVNALLALIAFGLVVRSRKEGEEQNPATQVLTPEMWPDKTLAAGLLMLIAGVITLVWGVAILVDAVTFTGYVGDPIVFGTGVALAGIVALVAARQLFVQERPLLGVLAALLVVASGSIWIVGPAIAVAAGVLIVLGLREHEFEQATAA